MATTIEDVAKQAGVSIATVSRVINHKPLVDGKTKERVESVMQKLNYVPNLMARGLMLNQTNTVGVLLPDITGEFFSELVRGIDDVAAQNKYHVLLSRIRKIPEELNQVLRLVREGRVDGLILMAPSLKKSEIENLVQQKFAVVVLAKAIESGLVDSILVDNLQGARQMVQHLIEEHKYNKIAFIGGPMDEPDSQLRYQGYKEIMEQHGIGIEPGFVLEGDFTTQSGYDKTLELLESNPRPRVIFCANDGMARGAIDALESKGIRVPEDIAIVGFDDVNYASHIRPPLTTVRQPIYQMGVLAMERLLKALREPDSSKESILFPTDIVIRESCGCRNAN